MINLKNTIDVKKLVIGGLTSHTVLLGALAVFVKPPTYEGDEARTTQAYNSICYLALYHFALVAIRYWNLVQSNFWQRSMPLVDMVQVITTLYLFKTHIYKVSDNEFQEMLAQDDTRQVIFHTFCCIEVAVFFSHLIGSAIFMFVRSFNAHFVEDESLLIDQFKMLSAPAIAGFLIDRFSFSHFKGELGRGGPLHQLMISIYLAQMVLYLFGHLTHHRSVYTQKWTTGGQADIIKCAVNACMYACPTVSILISIAALSMQSSDITSTLFQILFLSV